MSELEYYQQLAQSTRAELHARPWREIDEQQYYYWLEVVPPIRMKDGAFMVGECLTHCDWGGIYTTCAKVSGRYFESEKLLRDFSPELYKEQIQKQIGE